MRSEIDDYAATTVALLFTGKKGIQKDTESHRGKSNLQPIVAKIPPCAGPIIDLWCSNLEAAFYNHLKIREGGQRYGNILTQYLNPMSAKAIKMSVISALKSEYGLRENCEQGARLSHNETTRDPRERLVTVKLLMKRTMSEDRGRPQEDLRW